MKNKAPSMRLGDGVGRANRSSAGNNSFAGRGTLSPRPASVGTRRPPQDGYFTFNGADVHSPGSDRSEFVSMPFTSTVVATAFTALQYLPVPVIVLSSLKTVELANEAMARLLGIELGSSPEQGTGAAPGARRATDMLRGQTMSQVGIDLIQDGAPLWVNWAVSTSFSASLSR